MTTLRLVRGHGRCSFVAPEMAFAGAFRMARPRFEARQEDLLRWLIEVHVKAAVREQPDEDAAVVRKRIERLARHTCCGPSKIASRGLSVRPDGEDELRLHDVTTSPGGPGTAARMERFSEEAFTLMERLYAGEHQAPDDLVHVTCTGYISPSAGQRLVSERDWGMRTRVAHAYHMGCYAAVPALRLGLGLAHDSLRVDIVHTELCSLHFDPSIHTAEQLVVQSLFADGGIRYTVWPQRPDSEPAFRVLTAHEVLASSSGDQMGWTLGDHGMRMTLSAEVPRTIGRNVRAFTTALFARGRRSFEAERASCIFAVHPGGPKILDAVRDALELRDEQMEASWSVLRRFGNMSSATLPHIWSDLLETCAPGTLIASLAFGPGLTMAGALFERV